MPSINKIYKLRFTTPVRFGNGKNLHSLKMTASSDTLFSAIYIEAIRLYGDSIADEIREGFSKGEIRISSLMPYLDNGKETSYFLPKPISKISNNVSSYSGENVKKQLKALDYIKAEDFESFLGDFSSLRLTGEKIESYKETFAQEYVYDKVNLTEDEPKLYRVGVCSFKQGSGLYFICSSDSKFEKQMDEIVKSIGIGGIGGKTSSGYGKFVSESSYTNENASSKVIQNMMDDVDAPMQMTLGSLYPKDVSEISALKQEGSYYTLEKREGFVASVDFLNDEGNQMKRKSCVFIKEGSCLGRRIEGCMLDLSHGDRHPVWRLGKSIFLGVRV